MITRIAILLILMAVVPDLYIDRRFLRRIKGRRAMLRRLLWWLPTLGMIAYTMVFVFDRQFAPSDIKILNVYLFLVGLLITPKCLFAICSAIGWGVKKMIRRKANYGNIVGVVMVVLNWYVLFYGSFVGFDQITVREMTYESAELPESFDGYRIVQFSDAHVGTYIGGREHLLRAVVDTINAQCPDMVVFAGDLQNREPQEIRPFVDVLGGIKAKDGVFSVIGNHDYADYIEATPDIKEENEKETRELERKMGWRLLVNEHEVVRRGADSIVIAGLDNDGDGKKFPQRGDVRKALEGVSDSAFVVMAEHDPTCWRRKILPESRAQLTLSGHTHAMQFMIGNWSPASFVYKEWGGLFSEGTRALIVSTGIGGFIPFRFGVPGEIVVITMRRLKVEN
ncbi:MAG: metallophosphoesterase [Prevotella sp.]|nr:metallophosphoesterase [Prevotella sp.]